MRREEWEAPLASGLSRPSHLPTGESLVESKVPERSRFGTESFDQEEMVSKKCAGGRPKKARSRACAPDWALGNQYFVATSRLPGYKPAVRENRGPESKPHAGKGEGRLAMGWAAIIGLGTVESRAANLALTLKSYLQRISSMSKQATKIAPRARPSMATKISLLGAWTSTPGRRAGAAGRTAGVDALDPRLDRRRDNVALLYLLTLVGCPVDPPHRLVDVDIDDRDLAQVLGPGRRSHQVQLMPFE